MSVFWDTIVNFQNERMKSKIDNRRSISLYSLYFLLIKLRDKGFNIFDVYQRRINIQDHS